MAISLNNIYNNNELLDFIFLNTKIVNGCWEWQGAKTRGGYGHKAIGENKKGYKYYRIHRLVQKILHNHDSEAVLHLCDNPPCCNPFHLKSGTMLDNVRDMDEKKRRNAVGTKGVNCHLSKLSDKQVLEILHKRLNGQKLIVLAKLYNISTHAVHCIASGKTWNHVTGLPQWTKT